MTGTRDFERDSDAVMPEPMKGLSLSVLGQMRSYGDNAALDRVWGRLENRRRKPSMTPVVLMVSAAALLGIGVFVGMAVERVRSDEPGSSALALNATAEAPAARSGRDDSSARKTSDSRTEKSKKKKKKSKSKKKRRAKGLSTEITKMHDEDFAADELTAMMMAEPQAAPEKSAWLSLAERGDFAGAFAQLDELGGFDAVVQSAPPEELMTLVDVARYVGRQGRAIQALRVVTERHRSDPNAPLAAMMLGNLLSRAGDAAGAAEAFALNRRLSPGGDFAEDALVREFDMALSAGDLVLVEQLRSQYEQEFPDGSQLAEMRADATNLARKLARKNTSGKRRTQGGAVAPSGDTTDSGSSVPVGSGSVGSDPTIEEAPAGSESSVGGRAPSEPESAKSSPDSSKN